MGEVRTQESGVRLITEDVVGKFSFNFSANQIIPPWEEI